MSLGDGHHDQRNKAADAAGHEEQGDVVYPLHAPNLVVLIAKGVRKQQRKGDQQPVEATDVGGVTEPQRKSCKPP